MSSGFFLVFGRECDSLSMGLSRSRQTRERGAVVPCGKSIGEFLRTLPTACGRHEHTPLCSLLAAGVAVLHLLNPTLYRVKKHNFFT